MMFSCCLASVLHLLSNSFTHIFPQVYDMMLRDERYYPSFKQSPLYVRMLAELDMLKEPSYRGSDDGDGESFNGSPTGSINLVRLLHFLLQGSESNLIQLYLYSAFCAKLQYKVLNNEMRDTSVAQ